MVRVINLTPHSINVAGITIPPSGDVARVSTSSVDAGSISVDGADIPLVRTQFGDVQGLPNQMPDTFFIVSGLVQAQFPDRTDLLAPGDLVRDDSGKVIGAKNLRTQ